MIEKEQNFIFTKQGFLKNKENSPFGESPLIPKKLFSF
jgi:hypothetical protein